MALTIFLVVSCDETYHDMLPSMGVAQNPFWTLCNLKKVNTSSSSSAMLISLRGKKKQMGSD
jgi:hypothetical protein